MKRMLINATQPEELRVALIDGQSIYDFDIEQRGQERKRSNIYKAKISRIEQSLGAAFVDFGAEKHGFLPIKELAEQFLKNKNRKNSISECLTQGQEIIVQVEKEERGTKGAALSTFISLPGHYLVLMPNNAEAGGVSRSLEGEIRDQVRDKFKSLDVPEGMGLIARTAAEGASLEELKWDLDYLLSVWDAIQEANQLRKAPFLIYRDDDLISRSLRDFLRNDITEVLIDTDEVFDMAQDFSSRLAPELQDRIKRYKESIPLFTRYQVESQIETAYQREVHLNNGGSIVIDQTEALVSIDINSAKATGGSDIEETALKTNIEAAKEIAKQLRLRDIGGLIVIDFIDMSSLKNKRLVENTLHDSISIDRAKIQTGRISRFGLLEMSRQRLRPSLQERWTQDINSLSIAVLRLIEEESGKKKSGEVRAVVSSNMSAFLLNERRARINEIEERTNVRVLVISDPFRADNRFDVTRLRDDDKKAGEETSYEIQDEVESSTKLDSDPKTKELEKAAVKINPKRKPKRKGQGFLNKIINTITGQQETKAVNKSRSNQKQNFKGKPLPRKPQQNKKFVSKNSQKTKPKSPTDKKKSYVKEGKNSFKGKNKNLKDKGNIKLSDKEKVNVKSEKLTNKVNISKGKKEPRPYHKNSHKKNEKMKEDIPSKLDSKSITKDKESKEKLEKTKQETPIKKKELSAKDWGRASNDPRNKS